MQVCMTEVIEALSGQQEEIKKAPSKSFKRSYVSPRYDV